MQKLFALLKAVTAGAMLAVAGISYMDLGKFASHTVTVELAFRHAAGNAAIHIVFHEPLLFPQFALFSKKY